MYEVGSGLPTPILTAGGPFNGYLTAVGVAYLCYPQERGSDFLENSSVFHRPLLASFLSPVGILPR
eukprot:5924616-Heterocapsa_arctica.AAC.1